MPVYLEKKKNSLLEKKQWRMLQKRSSHSQSNNNMKRWELFTDLVRTDLETVTKSLRYIL